MNILYDCYVVTPESSEEVKLANEAILQYRAKKAHEELVQKHKNAISSEIADTVSDLGLETTKTIVRALMRELREL
jgi:hypothetical protein